MSLSSYSTAFVKAAAQRGLSEDDIAVTVKYSERLIAQGLPVIFDHQHLSVLSGFKIHFLYGMANSPYRSYRAFTIKKRDGSERQILSPMPDLKALQSWLASQIFVKLQVSKFSHAFRHGHSIKTNAKFHIGRKYVVKFDVVDFFGSTKIYKVERLLVNSGYTLPLAKLIAGIVTYDGSLPQGAPSSPVLSNSIYVDLDAELGGIAVGGGWRYTRYADDMTFSGDGDLSLLFSSVYKALNKHGLRANSKKTRVMRRGGRQIVCGVVLNESIGPSRDVRRKFFQEVHYVRKFGISGHIDRREIDQANYLESLIGRGSFLSWMCERRPGESKKIRESVEFLRGLSENRKHGLAVE